jgi:sugar phosphate isomerase/epimerase
MLALSGAAVGGGLAASWSDGVTQLQAETTDAASSSEPFGYCLNTSTIRGQELGIVAEVEIAAKAGYTAIEPWMGGLDKYVNEGGSLADLGRRISDLGLTVESAIGFAEWIVDDDARRAAGLVEARRNMEMLAQIGGKRLAAPPVGATEQTNLDLLQAAQRYRALCEIGEATGVVPQAEVWGFSKSLSRLGETLLVAAESGHPLACLLPDVYHLYKGGSDFQGLKLLSGAAVHVFHVNDYPDAPPRQEITDAHRVYPGDGVAPLGVIFRTLRDSGFRGMLSLELFNRDYWQQDALSVARTGLEKTREAVQKALA